MIANQDFVLNWQAAANNQPTAAHFSQVRGDEHFGMIMLMPPVSNSDITPLNREVIFVIDTSGSMAGTSMQQAKKALTLAVQELAETDTFNIIQFDSSAVNMSHVPLLATRENKNRAISYIKQLSAYGGTEIKLALQLALRQQYTDSEKLRQVIFITDGAVSNEAQLFNYINKNLQKSRLFTVGIGSAPNSFFMTEAAKVGKGTLYLC